MPNSYESQESLLQNNGERLFFTSPHSDISLHPTIQRLLFAGCIHLHPGAPGCTQFCTHLTQISRHLVILCYDALRSQKAKSQKPLITRDFEDCTQMCDCIKYRVLIFEMLDAMTAGKVDLFQKPLGKILKDSVSYHDTVQPESFYHGLILGFSVLTEDEYRVESNRESGYGRFDIAFFPMKAGAPGVILELKADKSEEALEEKAKEPLRQIGEKAYLAELSRQGVKEIWKYGISFHGKKVWLERGHGQGKQEDGWGRFSFARDCPLGGGHLPVSFAWGLGAEECRAVQ